ncbi:hypothetical protein BOTBODRAFT_27326 [Botryobasidium botryosum FD-172 SS1]|uniref:S-adenosyl-L-methionine-dependent methyltransferase n=1 Tax=Botryobasidium botryosum (strain FD-172 SS1) TaxID=930990 RepID=A0A067MVZ8_BOTB1|nr:hypothetical protein BOTBODRAFT_27326 [Botryobasidium botryosum FD-172 SS1]
MAFRPSIKQALCATVVLVLGVSIYIGSQHHEPYGDFHLQLNVVSGRGKHESRPETEWLNMGLWKDTGIFPDACEALALRMIALAMPTPGGRILDVGHGSGDSLLLHLSHPSVPRPQSLAGITSIKGQHQRASERVAEAQEKLLHASEVSVDLYLGDAVFAPLLSKPSSSEHTHPLDPDNTSPPFTSILALDCAYHFVTREAFLTQSFARLAPGGRIALADMAFEPSTSTSWYSILLARNGVGPTLSVPIENMVSKSQYAAQMHKMGYVNVTVEDISDDVFPGFQEFLVSKRGLWRIFARVIGLWVKGGGKFVLVSGQKPTVDVMET